MNFKKLLSFFMALVLLSGIVLPCLPVMGTEGEPHTHIYGDWVFDTAAGTQSKTCGGCGDVITLHGTDTKVSQVTDPVIGESYYLVANVAGELLSFISGGVTETTPYSLKTSKTLAAVTVNAALVAGQGDFQLVDEAGRYVYSVAAGAGLTVSANYITYPEKVSFSMDIVNGQSVIRAYGTGLILAAKNSEAKSAWRIFAVEESQLNNEGVYPVMLTNVHTHTYPQGVYQTSSTQHWQVCDCGQIATPDDHDYVMDDSLGYGVCVCGADNRPHTCQSTDGKWYADGEKHHQLCATCGVSINETDHTYGDWVFDTAAGTQSKTCGGCGDVITLHGTDTKVSQVTDPVIGESYYLVANVAGELLSFISGGVTETTPYSLKTSKTLAAVTVNAALVAGQGDFQLVDEAGRYVYSVAAGAGLTVSTNYITYPEKVSFSMDIVNGQSVIRAYGTGLILAAKYSEAKSAWRIFAVEESQLNNEGVYPVMLASLHSHSYGTAYGYDNAGHWQLCDCGAASDAESHNYVMDDSLGYGVCVCGADQAPHTCQSGDGVWYDAGDTHYQLCQTCSNQINSAAHSYGDWSFDTAAGTQTRICADCGKQQTLVGASTKAEQVTAPQVGQSYYLAANAAGTMYYFVIEGSVTDTVPYSLATTTSDTHASLRPVTLEAPVSGDTGFQLTVLRPADDMQLRIYCYDAKDSDGIMDTGTNSSAELMKHTFFVDELDGVKVLRQISKRNILALKYISEKGLWRILGVEESQLEDEGVYPAMLVNLHSHSYGDTYGYDKTGHWQLCDCGAASQVESHDYVMDETLGYKVCACGASIQPHSCVNTDGLWYRSEDGHYQYCDVCYQVINAAEHSYGQWSFDTESGSQSRSCSLCGNGQILHGTNIHKVCQETEPEVEQSYYLAANVAGQIYFFRHGQVTDTTPCSLWVTEDVDHSWAFPVTLEASTEGEGFQMTYIHPTSGAVTRIYCYDSVGSDGIMDTGVNSARETAKHTFYVDTYNGQAVLRKAGNNHILAVKYDEAVGAWRMLGVEESQLENQGVYPAMLTTLHQHITESTTYQADELGHWYTCACGGKSEYAEHTVTQWTYTVVPTRTTAGEKTGTCTICGAKAVAQVPPMVEEGYYYLTGTVDGVKYYYRDKTGKESVEDTAPFSLLTTDQEASAMQVNILWDEEQNTYTISYYTTRQLNLYMGDVNGSTIQKDGKIDLSSSATTLESLICFRWDPVEQVFYQLEGGVKYVIAFRLMTYTDGTTKAVRMLAVAEDALDANTVPAQLQLVHAHSYADSWSYDAISHWHACDCGQKKDEGAHQIDKWEVEKEATAYSSGTKTGICVLCGNQITQAIPMDTSNIQAPVAGKTYYLSAVLNGVRYYYRHTTGDQSVTTTTPYSLYTVTAGKSNAISVKITDADHRLVYGIDGYHLYISGDGVGVTSNESKTDLVNFQWDEENKVLYQMENGVKTVLVFKPMKNNKTGATEIRITSMALEQALIDPGVAIARLITQAPPEEPVEEAAAAKLPEGATALSTLSQDTVEQEQIPLRTEALLDHSGCSVQTTSNKGNLWVTVLIWLVIVGIVAVALLFLRNSAFGLWMFKKWNICSGICMVLAALVLLVAMLLPGWLGEDMPELAEFTIVTDAHNLDTANDLAVTLYEKYGVSLPVQSGESFRGDKGIYLDMMGLNSYGGYKYSVYAEQCSCGYGVYINGSGAALDTAISKWVKAVKDIYAFPFGQTEAMSGYEWNTEDINMTGLGFSLTGTESTALYEGVALRKLSYESFGYGKVTGYAVIVDSDADVELKVAAGQWDENTTTENPGQKHTVQEYGRMLTEDGYQVLAISNAGFYDLNTYKTYIPWGMQIVDGYVKKEPNEDNPNNTDNWFGQTADGKYVISNTVGYYQTYETTIAQGVGGGRVLMQDGKPCFSSTGADYRTVVGITKDGDLIILTMPSANYAFIAQIMMDMDMDIDTVLNLDGGGSTTLHSLDENGDLKQYICENPIEREVADAIAIVKKK